MQRKKSMASYDYDFGESPPCLMIPTDDEKIIENDGLKVKVNKVGYDSPINAHAKMATVSSSNNPSSSYAFNGSKTQGKRILHAPNSTAAPSRKPVKKQTKTSSAVNGKVTNNMSSKQKTQQHSKQKLQIPSNQLLQPPPIDYSPGLTKHQLAAQAQSPLQIHNPIQSPQIGQYQTSQQGSPNPEDVPFFFKAIGAIADKVKQTFVPPTVNTIQAPPSTSPAMPGQLSPTFPALQQQQQQQQPQMQPQLPPQLPPQMLPQPQQQQPMPQQIPQNFGQTTPYTNYYTPGIGPQVYNTPMPQVGPQSTTLRPMPTPELVGFNVNGPQVETPYQNSPTPSNATLSGANTNISSPTSSGSFIGSISRGIIVLAISISILTITTESEPSSNVLQQVAGFVNTLIRSAAMLSVPGGILYIGFTYLMSAAGKSSGPKNPGQVVAGQAFNGDPLYYQYSEDQGLANFLGAHYGNYFTSQGLPPPNPQIARYPGMSPATMNAILAQQQQQQQQPMVQPYIPPQNIYQLQPTPNVTYTPMVNQRQSPFMALAQMFSPFFSKQQLSQPQYVPPFQQPQQPQQQQQPQPQPQPQPQQQPPQKPPKPQKQKKEKNKNGKVSMHDYLTQNGIPHSSPISENEKAAKSKSSNENKNSKAENPTQKPNTSANIDPESAAAMEFLQQMQMNLAKEEDEKVAASKKGFVSHFSYIPAGIMVEDKKKTKLSDQETKRLHMLDLARDEKFKKQIFDDLNSPGDGTYLNMPPLPNIDNPAHDRVFHFPKAGSSLGGDDEEYGRKPRNEDASLPTDGTEFFPLTASFEAQLDAVSRRKPLDKKDKVELAEIKLEEEDPKNVRLQVHKVKSDHPDYYVDKYACKPYGAPPARYRGIKV